MRKYLMILCFCSPVVLPAQVFQPRDLIVSLGYGSYRGSFTATDTAGYSAGWGFSGKQFPLRIEYGISERLSVSVSLSYMSWGDRYFNRFVKHNIIEVGPGINYHLPWDVKRTDFAGEITGGLVRYNFRDYDTSNFSSQATGIFIRTGISPRIYFTKLFRFGALVYYRFSYSWMNGKENDHVNPQWEYGLQGYSHAYGIGLFYRFGSLRPSAYIDNTKSE